MASQIRDLTDDKGGQMKDKNDMLPKLDKDAFRCPHPDCGAYAHQHWRFLGYAGDYDSSIDELHDFSDQREEGDARIKGYVGLIVTVNKDKGVIKISTCSCCKHASLWRDEEMIYPNLSIAPSPNEDLPEKSLADYDEAASVLFRSPRAAAALLRLAIEEICVHVECKGTTLQKKIDYLISQNKISKEIAQAMDTVRIIGNEAVHPGTIDLRDNTETVHFLFKLVNRVAERLITESREINEFYDSLPDSKKRKDMPDK